MTRFRFVNIYFGDLLETFLAETGNSMDPTSIVEKNKIIENQVGSRGKFTLYNTPLSSLDVLHYKLIIYMFSWSIRALEKLFFPLIKNSDELKVKKFFYWVIFFHNRLHFALFNLFLAGGVLINARTLLHLPMWPTYDFFKFDKFFSIWVFIAYWSDIMELYDCAANKSIPPDRQKSKKQLRMEAVKKRFEKYKLVAIELEKLELEERRMAKQEGGNGLPLLPGQLPPGFDDDDDDEDNKTSINSKGKGGL